MSQIILASQSAIRAQILANAGVDFNVVSSAVDEDALKKSMHAQGEPFWKMAEFLADAKAYKVSMSYPQSLVVGADQMLVCQGHYFDKPCDVQQAREQLIALRGQSHDLITATVVFLDGQKVWTKTQTNHLKMRLFSDDFLDDYLQKMGDDICHCVAGCEVEKIGIQLLDSIKGDYFSILGLNLLPLVGYFQQYGALKV